MTHILPEARRLLAEIQNCRTERDLQTRVASALVLLPQCEELLIKLINCLHHLTSGSERAQARALVIQRMRAARETCWALNDDWARIAGYAEEQARINPSPLTRCINQLLEAITKYELLLKLPNGC